SYVDTIVGTGPGIVSLASISGTATLGSGTVAISPHSAVQAGTSYTILTDTSGGLGVGGNTVAPTVSFEHLTGALSYGNPDDVVLTFSLPTGCATGLNSATVPCVLETGTLTGPVGNASPGNVTKTGITVYNATIGGTLTNSGTVTGGIAIDSSTINGQISDTGLLSGGIFVDSASKITSANTAILITGPTFTGGISNFGTISSTGFGRIAILLDGGSTFTGGISNSGMIAASVGGITVENVSAFSGGISNSGTIAASFANGIGVFHITTFTGGISNSGTISAGQNDIFVSNVTLLRRHQQFRHDIVDRRRRHSHYS
ncbi:MAG: hypothetical protein WBV65_15555, partial [Xanthobacteraceae bacterium]